MWQPWSRTPARRRWMRPRSPACAANCAAPNHAGSRRASRRIFASRPMRRSMSACWSHNSDPRRPGARRARIGVVRPLAHWRKRLLVADMDSTMIGQECVDELADKVGLKSRIAAITERAMNGEIAFEPALRERVELLRGLPLTIIDDVLAERIRVSPGALALVHTMRAHGAYTCLVSGGFTLFTDRVAAMIGFHENRANRLIVAARRIEGVEEPILGRDAKLAALLELSEKLKLARAQTLAVGDGANDLAMLEAAGLGVAYRARPKVAASARARIDHGDLPALLYIQGYRREEFATG